jgi:hypothetical protein
MSLPALPAFTEHCIGRSAELAAILVTLRAGPCSAASNRPRRIVREERRAFAPAMGSAHTGGHIAYAGGAGDAARSNVRRATLLGSRRTEGRDVLAAPRAWKNDFR